MADLCGGGRFQSTGTAMATTATTTTTTGANADKLAARRRNGRECFQRGDTWGYEETRTLLNLWGNDGVQHQLATVPRNAFVFETLALKMQSAGFQRTGVQCKIRINNLLSKFKRANDQSKNRQSSSNGSGGGGGRKAAPFRDEINAILGSRPASGTHNTGDSYSQSHGNTACNGVDMVKGENTASEGCELDLQCTPEVHVLESSCILPESPALSTSQVPSSSSEGSSPSPPGRRQQQQQSSSSQHRIAAASRNGKSAPRKRKVSQMMCAVKLIKDMMDDMDRRFLEMESSRQEAETRDRALQREHERELERMRLEHEARENSKKDELFRMLLECMGR